MERVINIEVCGNHLTKDNKYAGTKGEGNATNLRITFDDCWDGYAKTVTFYDALGGNSVKRNLTTDLLENIVESTRIYLVPIPPEALTEAGTMSFVIDGSVDDKKQRSIEGVLDVKDAPDTDNPVDATPSQMEQMQGQYEAIIGDIQNAYVHRNEAEAFAKGAETAKEGAEVARAETEAFRNEAQAFAQDAEAYKDEAKESAEDAEDAAQRAENTLGKTSYIGENGNWYAWDSVKGEFYDTGVKAQSGSVLYIGENPPDEADVVIDPNGESAIYAPYIGENGNWYIFNPETQTFTDSGMLAKGDQGIQGEKGDKGSMQSISLRYDEATGNLYYNTDGIVADKEYVDTGSFADKATIGSMDVLKTANKSNLVAAINELYDLLMPTRAFVIILGGADNWVAEEVTDSSGNVIGSRYGQVVNVNNAVITPNSKVDLQLSSEQMIIFKEKDLDFVAENEDGVVTIYCIGNIPEYNYRLQATVTEVTING